MFFLLAALLVSQDMPRPSQAELEGALLAHNVRLLTHERMCPSGARNCPKPSKRIKVRNYDCQATGVDAKGEPILFCRVTYIHSGGALAHVQSNNECVPLRRIESEPTHHGPLFANWQVALVESKGKCPGGRE